MNAQEPASKTIKRILRPLVRRTLSPKTVQRIRFQWWYLTRYLPRLGTSHFVNRSPEVRGFGAEPHSNIVKQLQTVNLLAPTKMCRVMGKYGSDKPRNTYTAVYSALFNGRCDQPLRIFELGLGTNSPGAPSNMGIFGAPGASLRGWRELFPHALIYGADIDRAILFQEDRINTFYCDQLDRSSIRELWSHPDLQAGVDIVIEDGLHTLEGNITFLEESLSHVRPGGIYVIEDIDWDNVPDWYDLLEKNYSKKYPKYEFVFVVRASGADGNLVVIRRGGE